MPAYPNWYGTIPDYALYVNIDQIIHSFGNFTCERGFHCSKKVHKQKV